MSESIVFTRGLNELVKESTEIATAHGFTESTFGEDIALIHSELSEALEDFRHGHVPTEVWYEGSDGYVYAIQDHDSPRKPCGIPSEIADVIIRAAHVCGKYGIDLEKAVQQKMAFNRTRPFKHGKVL